MLKEGRSAGPKMKQAEAGDLWGPPAHSQTSEAGEQGSVSLG